MTIRQSPGFTSLELLVVIVTFVFLALLLPQAAKTRCGGKRNACLSNQKMIGLAFRMWANDHGEQFPMQLPDEEGGTRQSAWSGLPTPTFRMISNELYSPKLLFCPEDKTRQRAIDFGTFNENTLSYFLSVDASPTNAGSILTGDRNISLGTNPTNGLIHIDAPGLVSWTSLMHNGNGNVALTDGSAHQTTTTGLRQLMRSSGETNRWAVP